MSGASIDVLSQASQIKDERKQKTGTVEYVHDKTTYTASFINSVERDYKSNTTSFSLKQDMFGDLTTLCMNCHGAVTDMLRRRRYSDRRPVFHDATVANCAVPLFDPTTRGDWS